jgi:hypothetical protein
MSQPISKFLKLLSDYLSHRKGLLPMLGIVLVMVNYLLQWIPAGWVSDSHLFLHLGILAAIVGFLLAWAL